MKKLNRIIAGMAIVALAAGCAEEKGLVTEPDPATPQLPGTLITVNAGVETYNSLSKVALKQDDNTLDLVSQWQSDDVITIFARQDEKTYTVGNVTLDKISSDGRTCSFSIMLPGEINTSKEYEIYGVTGAGENAELLTGLKITTEAQRVPLADLKAPMMFYTTAKSTTVEASFQHIGAYEVLHVINTTGSSISFTHNGYNTASPWYYEAFKCYFNGDKHTSSSPQQSDGEAKVSAVTVPAGKSASIVSWYVPNGGTISNAVLKATIGSTEVTSANSKTSGVVIKSGNAYHLYATWDGTSLKFTDHTVTEISPVVSYSLSSAAYVYVGDESKMRVYTNKECFISVLIDGKVVAQSTDANATSLEVTLPTDTPGEYDVTLKASSGGIDAKVETFKFGVREKFETTYRTFDICGVPVEFVYVKGGTFRMGGTSEQGTDAQEDEFPVHSVSLDDFYIGKFEVTRQLYKAVMGGDPAVDDDKYPQGSMSWYSTMDFINKLRETTGMDFRLPTESEWEYAARGGQRSRCYKYAGSNLVGMVAHYNKNSSGTLQPCGTKMNNELGIFDMSGNVWEFCSGPYGTYPEDPVYNPQGSSDNYGVLRGGGGGASAADYRVSRRYDYYKWSRNTNGSTGHNASRDFGLRLVLDVE